MTTLEETIEDVHGLAAAATPPGVQLVTLMINPDGGYRIRTTGNITLTVGALFRAGCELDAAKRLITGPTIALDPPFARGEGGAGGSGAASSSRPPLGGAGGAAASPPSSVTATGSASPSR
jgi:hypothetical protein